MLELDKVKVAEYDRSKIENFNRKRQDNGIDKNEKEPVFFARFGKMASQKLNKCVDDFRQYWWIFG